MGTSDDMAVVKAWLTAIDERRLEDALALLADGWVEKGPGNSELGRDAFLADGEARLAAYDLSLTMHQQVEIDGHVATHYTWTGRSGQVDVLRLDVVRDGRMVDSHYSSVGGFA